MFPPNGHWPPLAEWESGWPTGWTGVEWAVPAPRRNTASGRTALPPCRPAALLQDLVVFVPGPASRGPAPVTWTWNVCACVVGLRSSGFEAGRDIGGVSPRQCRGGGSSTLPLYLHLARLGSAASGPPTPPLCALAQRSQSVPRLTGRGRCLEEVLLFATTRVTGQGVASLRLYRPASHPLLAAQLGR